jgi:hypothetical protein
VFPAQVVLASVTGVQAAAWVSGRFLLAAAGPGISSALSFAPSALAVLGLWGASGASSALGAQYLLQGYQLIATGGMLAPPGPYMQNYKDVAEVTNWALDPQALTNRPQPAQAPAGSGVEPSALSLATQAAADAAKVGDRCWDAAAAAGPAGACCASSAQDGST